MRSINTLAELQRSCCSKVDLDFVLSINHYISADSDDMQSNALVSDQFVQCIPCEAPVSAAADPRQQAMSTRVLQVMNAVSNIATSSTPHLQSDIKTHSLKIPGVLSLKRLEHFLDVLLFTGLSNDAVPMEEADPSTAPAPAMEVYRLKGIVHVAVSQTALDGAVSEGPSAVLHIVQAVHNIFEVSPSSFAVGGAQDTTQGLSLFVVIGKRLDMLRIEEELRRCLVEG